MNGRRLATFALALAVVHTMACLPFWPGRTVASALLHVSPDLAIVLGLALFGVTSGRRRMALHGGALLLTGSMLFGLVATIWPLGRDRAFEWSDVRELAGLPHLLFGLPPDGWVALLVLGPVVLALHLAAYFALRRLSTAGSAGSARGTFGRFGRFGTVAWLVILQGLVIAGVTGSGALWHTSSLGAMARETARTVALWLASGPTDGRFLPPPGAERMAAAPHDLRGLDGADVHILFLESYGRVALRHPAIGAHLRALWPQLERELQGAGFTAHSGACRPAISGGASLLAHAQFLAGVEVPDFRTWERMQYCNLRPLPHLFRDQGYHTVEMMPAMDRHWPEGAEFFGFVQQVTQLELSYSGFEYHFGDMPDQYALHHLLTHTIANAKQPVFSTYVSVTGHLPCTHIPHYIADWQINAETFAGLPAVTYATSWLNTATSPDTVPAYRDAVAYGMRTAVGFTCQLRRPSVVIVLGDHQPPIRGNLVPEDTSYDVPLHVFVNAEALVQGLAGFGLVPGIDVPDDYVAFDSAEFGPRFLRGFSRP